MKVEFHKRQFLESLHFLEHCIQHGVESSQRTIGFHTSAASIDLVSIYLFRKRLITPGTQINHHWFRSDAMARKKLPFDFPNKDFIFEKIRFIELNRDPFCYGTPKPEDEIRSMLDAFQELRKVLRTMGVAPEDET